jgi:glycolate oxidase FAD binding subunit
MSKDLAEFLEAIGDVGPVVVHGGNTRADVGGPGWCDAKVVRAPSGIREMQPSEMIVTVGAGTPIDEVQAALAEAGQEIVLRGESGSTVGGALATGQGSLYRLGHGPPRDALLQADVVLASGVVVRAGGPTVKNVTGYDLCRLLVGSLGTLACLGEVILRTRPRPEVREWYVGVADPSALWAGLARPASVLWDGAQVWVCLEGHGRDVTRQRPGGFAAVDGPPPVPTGRWSMRPGALASLSLDAPFVAEIGVGLVHTDAPAPHRDVEVAIREIHERLRREFDPEGRLNPGRDPLTV